MRFRGKNLIKLILMALGFIVAVIAAVLIGMWTKNIKEKKTNTQFRNQLSEIVNQYGERTLLEMAGIEVMDIFYSEEGVTIMEGEGLVSGKKVVLYCVLTRLEIYELKKIIKSIDQSAFVTISDVSEIIGVHMKKNDREGIMDTKNEKNTDNTNYVINDMWL